MEVKTVAAAACFFYLIRCNFASRVKLLLYHKADATIANAKGELPLHRASYSDTNMRVGFFVSVGIIEASFPPSSLRTECHVTS